jgi:hypothetical protein
MASPLGPARRGGGGEVVPTARERLRVCAVDAIFAVCERVVVSVLRRFVVTRTLQRVLKEGFQHSCF